MKTVKTQTGSAITYTVFKTACDIPEKSGRAGVTLIFLDPSLEC